jgi:imidazoleglycerol-phosphate dehydratase
MDSRKGIITRTTSETDITMILDLDGSGVASVDTGIGFFDHMLNSFAKHGFFDLSLTAKGDLFVDSHHTIEDVGIVLGKAIKDAVGDKAGIRRYASFTMPMDDALILCAVDLSGRPYLGYDLELTTPRVGYFDTEMTKEFFYAVSYAAEMNLHLRQLSGTNNHHIIEAAFKAFANALHLATRIDERLGGDILSTKGAL